MNIKEIAKSGLVAGFSLPPLRALANSIASDDALIFMLHRFQDLESGVHGHDPQFVKDCLEELRRKKYNLVSVDDIVDANLKGRPLKNAIAFTIDDGYRDHAEIGGPIFAAYDCPATYFLITDFVNGTYWPEDAKVQYLFENTLIDYVDWKFDHLMLSTSLVSRQNRLDAMQTVVWAAKELPIERMQQATNDLATALNLTLPNIPPSSYQAMTWDDARNLEKKGMRIGAHTCRHVTLSKENDVCAKDEITKSIAAVRSNVAKPSKVFCYPTGRYQDFSPRDVDVVRASGFTGALTAEWGYHITGNASQHFAIPRLGLPNNLVDFRQLTLYVEYFKIRLRGL